MRYPRNIFCFSTQCLLLFVLLFTEASFSEDNAPERLSEAYPDLPRGILTEAFVQPLPKDVLVRVRDKDITREILAQKLDSLSEKERGNASNLLFYLLENVVERPIILSHIFSSPTLPETSNAIKSAFKKLHIQCDFRHYRY